MRIYSSETIKAKLTRRKKIGKMIYVGLMIVIVFAIICVGLVFCQKLIFRSKNVRLFGCASFIVSSGSMQPSIEVYDIVVVKKVEESEISAGDIITFFDKHGNIVTHRVVEISVKDGKNLFTTKGDANNGNDAEPVFYENIIGRYGFKLPGGGYVATAVASPMGIGFFLLAAILICLMTYRKNKRKAARHSIREKYKHVA